MIRIAFTVLSVWLLHTQVYAEATPDPATAPPSVSTGIAAQSLRPDELPASLAVCGTTQWMPMIGALVYILVEEHGLIDTTRLMDETLNSLLPALDQRLSLQTSAVTSPAVPASTPRWAVTWEGKSRPVANAHDPTRHPRSDLVSQVYDTLADACALLQEHDAVAAKKIFHRYRGFSDQFEAAFVQALRDPAAEFGFDSISLSINAKGNKSPNESFSVHWVDQGMGIARIYLPNLFSGRDQLIDAGLDSLQAAAPVQALILDLRGSGGGQIKDLHAMLERFLPKNTPLYDAYNRRKEVRHVQLPWPPRPKKALDMPLLVLVSKQTRAGAEILAGVLQGTGRAKVFGEPTAGLATLKRIVDLGPGIGIDDSRTIVLTEEVLVFPGQHSPQIRIQPDVLTTADKAFDTALATLAVNGQMPQNPFIRQDEKVSALVRAVLSGKPDEAVRLIEAGAALDVEASPAALNKLLPRHRRMNHDSRTPQLGYPLAIVVAALGQPRVLRAIGQRCVQCLRVIDLGGLTALAYAARSGFVESTRYLLSQGLDPIQRAHDYPTSNTPLALAVQEKRSEVVGLLLAAIPKQKYSGVEVAEQVWFAAYFDNIVTMRVLLDAGVPPHYIAPQGDTALIASVNYGKLAQVQLLLKAGATVDDHPYKGQTIFDIANENSANGRGDTKEIARLIQAAPRTTSTWQKSKEVQRWEDMWKLIEGRKP